MDDQKRLEEYKILAEQGDPDAQNNLGECYYYGEGVPRSYEKAAEWFPKATV